MNLERMASIGTRLSATATDGVIVGGLAAAGLVQAWPGHLPSLSRASSNDWLEFAAPFLLALATALPLAWRRAYPLAAGTAVSVMFAIGELTLRGTPSALIAMVAASYAIGRYASPRESSRVALIAVVALEAVVALAGDGLGVWLVFVTAVTIALWIVGDAIQQHEDRNVLLEERSARLEAEQQAASARAAAAERARIARELHDVIAHDVTVMVVQATAAGRILDHDPAEARRSLAAIESTGRLALTEMRRLLGAIHHDDGPPPTEPQPSLSGLARLVDGMRASGLEVDLVVAGRPRDVSPGVDLSAYRIVQEALTNALRHGGSGPTHVSVTYTDAGLEIDVTNDRPPAGVGRAGPPTIGGGRGIAGMRERVALVHGELHVGPERGGYRVRARLPLVEP